MKTESVEIRMDPAEKKAFQEAAELSGLKLSSWARERLRRAARIELEDVGRPVPFVRRRSPSMPT